MRPAAAYADLMPARTPVRNSHRRVTLQKLRVLQVAAQARPEEGVLVAGADTLIHDNGERDQFFIVLACEIICNRLAHADEHARRAELVAVVKDRIRIDGGKVRDKKARVERAQINDFPR